MDASLLNCLCRKTLEISTIHPDIVYSALSSKPGRSERREALRRIHEVCANRYKNGNTDFSVSAIGKECESEGFLRARALYNASSADYKALIDTWSQYGASHASGEREECTGGSERRTSKRRKSLLPSIADPAIRADVEVLFDERDRLRIQLSVVEAEKNALRHEMAKRTSREQTPVRSPRGRPLKNIPEWVLKPGDYTALENAIFPEFVASQGWSLGPQGEIRNALGATLYEPGYLQGMRKLLANRKKVD